LPGPVQRLVAVRHAHAMVRNGYWGSALRFGGPPFIVWARPMMPGVSIGTLRAYRCGRGASVNWMLAQIARSEKEKRVMLLPSFQLIGAHWVAFNNGPGFWQGRGRCHVVVVVFSGILTR
jgi:hypothetical protein